MSAKAENYVGTNRESGAVQFEILKREGLMPHHKVLEVGCGCLNAGLHVIRYLDANNYVGIEPNKWLIDDAMESSEAAEMVRARNAFFLHNSDFDASSLNIRFDYVLSHSVLSHCANWQLGHFLGNTARVLKQGGKIVASIRLAEGNVQGSRGSPDRKDSFDHHWQYPGVSWFTQLTVASTAFKLGLAATLHPEYTELMVARRPTEIHDWMVFHKSP